MTAQPPLQRGTHARLAAIPVGDWRDDGLCVTHPNPTLWDGSLDGAQETINARAARHAAAKRVCWRGGPGGAPCPVRARCAADVDASTDEGVRGGHVLPSIHVQHRNTEHARALHLLLRAGAGLDQAAELLRLLSVGVALERAAILAGPLPPAAVAAFLEHRASA